MTVLTWVQILPNLKSMVSKKKESLQAEVCNLKKFLSTENVAVISTGSKVRPEKWGVMKKVLNKLGLHASKTTNMSFKKVFERSSLSQYTNLSVGSVLITKFTKNFKETGMGDLTKEKGLLKFMPSLSLKLHNRLYPVSWLSKNRCLVYSEICVENNIKKINALKKVAKLSCLILKLKSKQRDSNT